jgi:hypothetical protein
MELFGIRRIIKAATGRKSFPSATRAEVISRQSECANPRIRLTVLYRETEIGKRLIGRAQAICILDDVPITDLRWDWIMARDIAGGSAWELIRFFKNIIVIFEEAQNIFNSTSHVVEVMNASYTPRCLLKLGFDEAKETCDVCGQH